MRKYALSLALAIALPFALSAQSDSSRYDIGYLTLNKNFTQHVTIRGEDLEKMPFVNLSEALRAWFFGAYTGSITLAYVVDGNPVTDVDLYPIYEIEEVTLIQNAVATAAYGNGQQELVLVTTRRGKGKGGMRVTAQTGLVNGEQHPNKTRDGVYHQYYLGAYRNLAKFSFGGSAGWQRDIQPDEEWVYLHEFVTPENLQRWRFNGWMEWRPDPQNTIGVQLHYGTQRQGNSDSSRDPSLPFVNSLQSVNHLLIPQLTWEGRWLPGLHNKFDAEYLYSYGSSGYVQSSIPNGSSTIQTTDVYSNAKNSHLVLRDRLSLEAKTGNWQIVPALDLSYQHIDERAYNAQQTATASRNQYVYSQEEKGSLFYLAPTVDLSLARALDIGAGVMMNASSKVESGNRRFFPFITGALDLLHLDKASMGGSLKVFGSYARRPSLYIDDYSPGDLINSGGSNSLYTVYHNMGGYFSGNGFPLVFLNFAGNEPGYWTWDAGAEFTTESGRLTLQYSYQRRNMSFMLENYNNYWGYEPWTENLHHIDLRFKLIDSKTASWFTGINVSLMRSKGDTTGFQPYSNFINGAPIGDVGPPNNVSPSGSSWTGGWVNRLRLGRFSAGLDLLYHFGDYYFSNAVSASKNNPVVLPNVYAGYRWKLGAGMLELFAQSSALVRSKNIYQSDLWDYRKFYTVGGSYSR